MLRCQGIQDTWCREGQQLVCKNSLFKTANVSKYTIAINHYSMIFFAKFVLDCHVITGSWFPMDWCKVSQLTLYRLRICCQSSVPLWWQTQGTPVEEARQNVFVMQLPLALLISGCFACRAILIATHLRSTVTLWECCRLTGEVGFCYDQIIVLGLWKSYGDFCTGRLMHALP